MRTSSLCAVALIMLVGCQDHARVAALEKRVEALEKTAALRQDPLGLDRFITLTADANGYQVVHVDTGPLLVRVDDLTQYLDGYKFHIGIGNPQSVTYTGCKLELLWAGKSKTEYVTERLRPGYWTSVELIVTPASVEEVRDLRLAIDTSQIEMFDVRKK